MEGIIPFHIQFRGYMDTVRLVSYTQPAEEFANEGISDLQELIAFCARVSNPSNQFNSATAEKLINYLIKHKHYSPLEMVNVCLEINTTRDIGRQILRHASYRFQEFSQRYADPTKELMFVTREARLQDTKNKQNSIELNLANPEHLRIATEWNERQNAVIDTSLETYQWAITNGIAKELARCVLPEGNTMSRMYMNGTIRSWIHYIEVRTDVSTQKEHREIALACANAISQIFPMASHYVQSEPVVPFVERLKNWFK